VTTILKQRSAAFIYTCICIYYVHSNVGSACVEQRLMNFPWHIYADNTIFIINIRVYYVIASPAACTPLKYVVVYTPAINAYSNATETTLPLSPPLSSYWCFISGCFLTGLQPQPQQAVGSAANNYSTNLTSLTSSLSSLGVSAGTFLPSSPLPSSSLLMLLLLLLLLLHVALYIRTYIYYV